MNSPVKIRPKGSEATYILESVATNKNGQKVKFEGQTYIKEELPAEYVMFEGVAYKRTMSLADYNRKVLTEAKETKAPKKIKIKGTDVVLEAKE